jgi:hypothetical protein
VDPPGHHPRLADQSPHHPRAGAHGRDHRQVQAGRPPPYPRPRPRAIAREIAMEMNLDVEKIYQIEKIDQSTVSLEAR